MSSRVSDLISQLRNVDNHAIRDQKLLSLAATLVYAMGGSIGVSALLLSHDPSTNRTMIAIISALAYASGAGIWLLRKRLTLDMYLATAVMGAVLISFAVYWGGNIGAVPSLIYVWEALYVYTFFTIRQALGVVALMAIGFTVAATASHGVPVIFVIGVLGTILIQSPFVRYLVMQIDDLSRIDPLTSVANRRAFAEQMEYTSRDVQRSGRSNAVIMLDIDYFKQFNDRRGHLDGDQFLCDVTQAWLAVLRESDVLARYGGEEFVALLRDCDLKGALECADRLRNAVPSGMTCSAGVAAFQRGEDNSQLLARVDLALYEAKHAGRNRTVRAPEKLPPDLDVTAAGVRENQKLA